MKKVNYTQNIQIIFKIQYIVSGIATDDSIIDQRFENETDFKTWMTANVGLIKSLTVVETSGNVTDCIGMFRYSTVKEVDLSNFNTKNSTNMAGMFFNASNIDTANLSNLRFDKITSTSNLFSGCVKLADLQIGTWDMSNVTTTAGMFGGCKMLKSTDFSKLITSGTLTRTSTMFSNCETLTELDLSGMNIENVTNTDSMFSGCTNLKTLNLSTWNTSKITVSSSMFKNCTSLETVYCRTQIDANRMKISNDCAKPNAFIVGSPT